MARDDALTDERHWDENFAGFVPTVVEKVGFYEIYERFLQPAPDQTVLEIGCGGGRHLCWLAKKYQYRPYGIDYSEVGLQKTRETFAVNGLPAPVLYQADLFKWKTEERFDLVCSFGFVEHFADFAGVIARHAELVKPGGLLIFGMPHMAHLNYVFRWLVDRETLRDHNTRIMNLRAIRAALRPLPFDILHLNYYRTFAFPPPRPGLTSWQKAAYVLIYNFGRTIRKLFGRKRPNFLISPKIICVARRRVGPLARTGAS